MRFIGEVLKLIFVLHGDDDEEVRFGMPSLCGVWILTGKRKGRVNGLGSLISSWKIAADNDVELLLRGNLRRGHVLVCPFSEVT